MGLVYDVIEVFWKVLLNVECGIKFEQLMVCYFELDLMMVQQYDVVWWWIDWLEWWGRIDIGIDLVVCECDIGNYIVIQCKFYELMYILVKGDIDLFFIVLGKMGFINWVIIFMMDWWGCNVEDVLVDQLVLVQCIGMVEIVELLIDWDIVWLVGDLQVNLILVKCYELWLYQQQVIDVVFCGFVVGNDCGKLIMVCGIGKMFIVFKIVECIVVDNGGSVWILLLVFLILLLSQMLWEWIVQSELDVWVFVVCLDIKVLCLVEDYYVYDVLILVIIDVWVLLYEMVYCRCVQGLIVVFCIYQLLFMVVKV